MTGEGRAHAQGPLEKAHTLTCRADEAYREGEFAPAAKLYLEAASGFDAAVQEAQGCADEHALGALRVLAESHRRKAARVERLVQKAYPASDAHASKFPAARETHRLPGAPRHAAGGAGLQGRSVTSSALEYSTCGTGGGAASAGLAGWVRFGQACARLTEALGTAVPCPVPPALSHVAAGASGAGGAGLALDESCLSDASVAFVAHDLMMGSVCMVARASDGPSSPAKPLLRGGPLDQTRSLLCTVRDDASLDASLLDLAGHGHCGGVGGAAGGGGGSGGARGELGERVAEFVQNVGAEARVLSSHGRGRAGRAGGREGDLRPGGDASHDARGGEEGVMRGEVARLREQIAAQQKTIQEWEQRWSALQERAKAKRVSREASTAAS